MEQHYSAFISYRHHPDDIAVATEVQHQLERYKIPKALQKKLGITKLDRVFRDKEELPITSNLNDDIGMALRNADHLIVICSTHTKESIWVQREIDTFLQTHDRSKVLTALVNGEPGDTIPECLLSEKVVMDDGTIKTRLIEPLSCDFRSKDKKIRKQEINRLAASVLGCPYDELVQRQKQYEMRRLTTIFSIVFVAMVAFMSYVIYSSIQIRNNLNDSLRNQSTYLASESLKALDNGDTILAAQLALEALPSENNERPIVNDAIHALYQATNTYNTDDGIVALGSFAIDGDLLYQALTKDGEQVVLFDSFNTVSVFDANTFVKTLEFKAQDTFKYGMEIYNDKYLIGAATNGVDCYLLADGSLVWHYDFTSRSDIVIAQDKVVVTYSSVIAVLDCVTGEVLNETPTEHWCIRPIYQYDNDTPYLVGTNINDDDKYDIFLMNLSDYSTTIIDAGYEYIDQVQLINGKAYITGYKDEFRSNSIIGESGSFQKQTIQLASFDYASNKQEWENSLMYYLFDGKGYIIDLGDDKAVFIASNVLQYMDLKTGKIISKVEASNTISYARADTNNRYIIVVTSTGDVCTYYYDEARIFISMSMLPEASKYLLGNGTYVVKDGVFIRYGRNPDDSYTIYEGGERERYLYRLWYQYTDQYLIEYVSDYNLYIYDIANQALLQKLDMSEYVTYTTMLKLVGISGDASKVYMSSNKQFFVYDVQTNSVDVVEMEYSTNCLMHGDTVYFVYGWDSPSICQYQWDENGDFTKVKETTYGDTTSGSIEIKNKNYPYVFYVQGGKPYCLNVETETVEEIPLQEEMNFYTSFYSGNHTYAIQTEHLVSIFDENMKLLTEIAANKDTNISVLLMDELKQAWFFDSYGNINRYDYSGNLLATTSVTPLSTGVKESHYQIVGDELYVGIFRALYAFDVNTLELRYRVCFGEWYDETSKTFVISNVETIAAYQALTLEEVKEKARAIIGDAKMTDKQKKQYGLE